MDKSRIRGIDDQDDLSIPQVPDSEASPVANAHVNAVLGGQDDPRFATEYEHFGSFLSWSKSG